MVMDEYDLFNLVSVDNTKWILQEHRRKRFISTKKPALNKKHLKATLNWPKWHELWDGDAWHEFTFSTEAKMELHSKKFEFVRRRTGKWNACWSIILKPNDKNAFILNKYLFFCVIYIHVNALNSTLFYTFKTVQSS